MVRLGVLLLVLVVGVLIWSIEALVRFGRDMVRNARSLARGGGAGAMAAMERSIQVADLLTMALLADGEITPPKRTAFTEVLQAAKVDVKPAEAINRLRLRTPELKQPERLREAVASVGAALAPKDREEVLRHVVALGRAGAGVLGEGDYRAGRRPDPGALVELFALALGVSAGARDAAIAGLDGSDHRGRS